MNPDANTTGLCRTCGTLLRNTDGTWNPVQPGRTCRYGTAKHPRIDTHPRAARLIAAGHTHVPAGDILAPA